MRRRSGWTLVATLITITIMLILAAALFMGSGAFGGSTKISARKDGKGTTVMGAVRYDAQDSVCLQNLGTVRQAIQVQQAQDPDSHFPATLEELKLPKEVTVCDVAPHEPYQYDPATGQVHCPHPGHEKY